MVTLTRACLSRRLGTPPPPSCRLTCDVERTPKREFRKLTIRRGLLVFDDSGEDPALSRGAGGGTSLAAGALLNLATAGCAISTSRTP
jgi:hypothetical protein